MKVEPISVSGSYEYMDNYGLKRWKKISIGATITDDDNVIDCIAELDKKVEEAYKNISKELSVVADNVPVPIVEIQKTKEESDIDELRKCTTQEELNTFTTYVKGKPTLEAVYFLVKSQIQKNARK